MKKDRESASAGKPPQGDASAAAPASRWASLVPWLALPIGIAFALLFARRPDVVGLMHDDGVYLSMAREISAGRGPVDGHVPEPARTARFPPLHPLVLAVESGLLGVPAQGLADVHRLIACNAVWVQSQSVRRSVENTLDRHGLEANGITDGAKGGAGLPH
jgi:hypothetical protein